MTERAVVWAPVARQDLREIVDYLRWRESRAVAARVARRILDEVATLAAHGERCRVVPELREAGLLDYHELIIRPHRVVFNVAERTIGIIAVFDARRELAELLLERVMRSSFQGDV